MKLLHSLVAATLLLAGHSALAAQGSAINATIKRLQINKALGNMVFIELTVPPQTQASCAAGAWHFLLSLDEALPVNKNLYVQLLTAYSTGGTVDIAGTGLCEWGTVEDLATVALH